MILMAVTSMLYFYVPGAYSVLEKAKFDKEVKYRGVDSGKSLSELTELYPSIKLLTMEACTEHIRSAARSDLEEIGKYTFMLFRESIIFDYHEDAIYTTFKCQEFMAADIATYFLSIRNGPEIRYYSFRDIDTLSHHDIISRGVKGSMEAKVETIAS